MKNKKSIYILLPLVLLIWGTVVYQFFSYADTEEPLPAADKSFTIKPLKIKPKDTFSINVNYRDPFLGKMYVSNTGNLKKVTVKKEPKPEQIVWPVITYKGIVSDTKEKAKVFLVIINEQTFLMKKGDKESEVLLKDGNKTAIQVNYKNNSNVIARQL